MAHITLSVPDELYKEMKKHPEIKWSEAAREGITRQISQLRGVISGKDLLQRLDSETREAILRIPGSEWAKCYKKIKESEKRRLKLLTQALQSKRK